MNFTFFTAIQTQTNLKLYKNGHSKEYQNEIKLNRTKGRQKTSKGVNQYKCTQKTSVSCMQLSA